MSSSWLHWSSLGSDSVHVELWTKSGLENGRGRRLLGKDAANLDITSYILTASIAQWKYEQRILLGRLRDGAPSAAINKLGSSACISRTWYPRRPRQMLTCVQKRRNGMDMSRWCREFLTGGKFKTRGRLECIIRRPSLRLSYLGTLLRTER